MQGYGQYKTTQASCHNGWLYKDVYLVENLFLAEKSHESKMPRYVFQIRKKRAVREAGKNFLSEHIQPRTRAASFLQEAWLRAHGLLRCQRDMGSASRGKESSACLVEGSWPSKLFGVEQLNGTPACVPSTKVAVLPFWAQKLLLELSIYIGCSLKYVNAKNFASPHSIA